MRPLLPVLLLLVLLPCLAACAPAAVGASPSSAFDLAAGSIRVGPSAPFYVQTGWSFGSFAIKPKDLSASLWVPTGVDSEGAIVTTSFSLRNLQVPEGWGLELVQVKAERRAVAGRRTFDESTTEQSLTALFRVTPKPDAVAGPYSLRGDAVYRRGGTQPFRIDFTLVR